MSVIIIAFHKLHSNIEEPSAQEPKLIQAQYIKKKLERAKELAMLAPDSPKARRFLAIAAYEVAVTSPSRKDIPATADRAYRDAVAMEPDNAFLQAEHGCFLLFRKRFQEAATSLQKAHELQSAHPLIMNRLLIALHKSDPSSALRLVRSLRAKDPDNPEWLYEEAGALREMKQFQEALSSAEEAVNRGGDKNFRYLGRLASCLKGANRLDESEVLYSKIIRLFPDNRSCRFWRLKFLVENRPEKQIEALDDLLELNALEPMPAAMKAEWEKKIEGMKSK